MPFLFRIPLNSYQAETVNVTRLKSVMIKISNI